jgi:tetratricopeptide (TPR) repeat protein
VASAAVAAAEAARRASEKIEVLLSQEKRRVEELAAQTAGARIISDLSLPGSGTPRVAPDRVNPYDIENDDRTPWNTGVTPGARDAARQAFLEGNRLFHIPVFLRAAEKYTEALTKWKHPVFYFNLAITQINLGQYLEAHHNLDTALAFGAEPLGADRAREARKQLGEIERQLGQIHIRCSIPGAEVLLDGEPLFTSPGSRDLWVSARAHEVTASKPGYAPLSKQVIVAAGAQQTVTLSPHRTESPP